MNRKLRRLLILAGALVLVAAGYLVLSGINQEAAEDIALRRGDPQALAAIDIQNEKGTFHFEREDGGAWRYTEDESFPLNQAYGDSIEDGAAEIVAKRRIDTGNFAKYGLDAPQSIVTVTEKNGERFAMHIGAQNTATTDYYFRMGGSDDVYIVADTFANKFLRGILDMAALVPIEDIELSQLGRMEMEPKDGAPFAVEYMEDAPTYAKGPRWMAEQAGEKYLSADRIVAGLKDAAVNLRLDRCVAYQPDAAKLAGLGLDAPDVRVTLEYAAGGADALRIGGRHTVVSEDTGEEEAWVYVYYEKWHAAYAAKETDAAPLLEATLDSARSPVVCAVEFDEIDSLRTSIAGESHEISIQHVEKGLASYVVDGVPLEAGDDSPWDVIYAVNSMQADAYAPGGPAAGAGSELRVELRRLDGAADVVVEYYAYDANFYLAQVNGGGNYLVNRRFVETLKQAVQAF